MRKKKKKKSNAFLWCWECWGASLGGNLAREPKGNGGLWKERQGRSRLQLSREQGLGLGPSVTPEHHGPCPARVEKNWEGLRLGGLPVELSWDTGSASVHGYMGRSGALHCAWQGHLSANFSVTS